MKPLKKDYLEINEKDNNVVKRLLILYEERVFFIGDNCLKLDKLALCKALYPNAYVHINFKPKFLSNYIALIKNNPNFDKISADEWDDIDFESYDMIICASYDEPDFQVHLADRYSHTTKLPLILSTTKYLLDPIPDIKLIYPTHDELFDFANTTHKNKPQEIHVSLEEKTWADNWLLENGLNKDNDLAILIDSSTSKNKLLRIEVYFDFLEHLLTNNLKMKILIFDEKNIGKEDFYSAFLGKPELFERIIFSKGLKLREDISLIASSYTKLVFGPCTGLLHCASGIFNAQKSSGIPNQQLPKIIVYTGKYFTKNNNTAKDWWSNSPLVECLILKKKDNLKVVNLLRNCNTDELNSKEDLLLCEDYELDLLVSQI